MKSYIKQELRRAFWSKRTKMMYLFSIILFFSGMFQYIQWLPSQSVSITYTFLAGYNSSTLSYLALLFPLISSIPYATSYIEDCESGFNKLIYMRMNKNRYLHIRVIINALVGGFTLVIGPICAFLFLLIMKFTTNATLLKKNEQMETVQYFYNQGIFSPILMIMIIISLIFICGVVISTFTLGLSTIIQNNYFTALSSFILLLLSAIIFTKFSTKLSLVSIYDVDHFGMTFLDRFIYESILIVLGLTLIYKNGRRVEEKYI
ncbi:MAG: hypothetical protein ACRC0Q_06600 [Kurthia gibsonii]